MKKGTFEIFQYTYLAIFFLFSQTFIGLSQHWQLALQNDDSLIISTVEYIKSIPALFKNAL